MLPEMKMAGQLFSLSFEHKYSALLVVEKIHVEMNEANIDGLSPWETCAQASYGV
jgi:hypothetical protein